MEQHSKEIRQNTKANKMILEFFIIKKRISKYLDSIMQKENEKVLDLGCGNAPYYHKFIKGKLICFDIAKTNKVSIVGDADFLPFKSNFFDKVISINSLYYFKNPFNVVENVSRILKRNGKFIIVLPFFYPIHDAPIDKYRFSEHGLRSMLGKNFRIEKLHAIGGIFTLPSVVVHSIIKGFPLLFPKVMQKPIQIFTYVLFPVYIILQFLSIFDFIDRTRRMPTYYFVVASKK